MPEVISKSAKETQKIGERLARFCFGGEIIGLIGDLGGGKTTFVQGIACGLGISQQITSPSFVLMKKYPISNPCLAGRQIKSPRQRRVRLWRKISNLYHIDLYRVATLKDVYSFGFDEVLKDERGIIVIEWAEKVIKILPEEKLIIEFDFLSENERKIVFKPKGKRYEELVAKVIR